VIDTEYGVCESTFGGFTINSQDELELYGFGLSYLGASLLSNCGWLDMFCYIGQSCRQVIHQR